MADGHGRQSGVEPVTERDFVISRVFDAPRSLVFRTWTEPKYMSRWWGPRPFTCPVCEMDVRTGGRYRIVMRSPEGTDYPINGVYREIIEPERIVMTMDCTEHPAAWHDMVNPNRGADSNPAGEMVATITFEDHGGKTKLTIHIRFKTASIRESMVQMGMNEGWSQSLDRLTELLSDAADIADRVRSIDK